jgi:hypothetical protein
MDLPVHLELDIKDLEFVSRFETRLDVQIEFAAGPVVLRKIPCYIGNGAIHVILV